MAQKFKRRSFLKTTSAFTLGLGTSQTGIASISNSKLTESAPLEIGTRLELFVDDYLIDNLKGGIERRLHHPVPREVIMTFGDYGKPWDGNIGFPAVVQDGERILVYYRGQTKEGRDTANVIVSTDGINFIRPALGIIEFEGSKKNNIVWSQGPTGHNFTPFTDTNPAAPPEERFKAVARPPKARESAAMGAFVSPDGFNWKFIEEAHITRGPSDSQNLAFWDPLRKIYVCYLREFDITDGRRIRTIRRTISKDFIEWGESKPIEYTDNRLEQMYTNGIRPYYRAPHIYIGTPARFVNRKKVPEHPYTGINDVVLMSSRDGIRFQRWEEAFIRPGPETELWTDRNYYPAQNTVQTSPTELSFYWMEHYRHPTVRLRRGTIRIDGFVSIHSGGTSGEMLTRPLIFSGNRLIVNYATSAIGTLRFELCEINGTPIEGLTMNDSEVLYGNEIKHTISWKAGRDLSRLEGKPVRLRIRLHDADIYSIRFVKQ